MKATAESAKLKGARKIELDLLRTAEDTLLELVRETVSSAKGAKVEQLTQLRAAFHEACSAIDPKVGAELQRAAFVARYGIKVLSEHEVSYKLGSRTPLEMILEAQDLVPILHKHLSYPVPLAVNPSILSSDWQNYRAFSQPIRGVIAVDGRVEASVGMSREEYRANGWCDVSVEELAGAHVAFHIATGKDLFGGHVVAHRGGAMVLGSNGLLGSEADNEYDGNLAFRPKLTCKKLAA